MKNSAMALLVGACMAGSLGASASASASATQIATAIFIGPDGKDAGKATLTGTKTGVLIEAEVSGLPVNKWVAFHIHENGKCDAGHGNDSAGGHFNPGKTEHGYLSADGPHAGDLPNQYVGADGIMRAQVFDAMVSLDGKDAVRGRSLIIHENFDDYRGQPAGGAGKRLACAVIK